MENVNEKAAAYFAQNQSCKEVFATKDGYLFEKKADATAHAVSLNAENPEVQTLESKKAQSTKATNVQDADLVKTYFELYEQYPSEALSNIELQELIDAKLAE